MCSYCGCRESLGIIARFSAEHDEIVNALGDLRRAVSTGTEIASRADSLRNLLDPHTECEERSLFAELRKDPEFTDVVDGLCAEHVALGLALDDVVAGTHGAFDVLEPMLMRHIDKEENGLFPAAIMVGIDWDRAIAAAG